MKLLLLGASGQLGSTLKKTLKASGLPSQLVPCSRQQLDLRTPEALTAMLDTINPDVIINAAAYTAVDQAETAKQEAFAVNAVAVTHLAEEAARRHIWLIHYSTDYVFDGEKDRPYLETDAPNPLNIYGASKLAGEQAILQSGCQNLIFRTSWIIGAGGRNFAATILRLASERQDLQVVQDQRGSPTSPDLIATITARALQNIAEGRPWPSGRYHLTAKGETNWFELARLVLQLADELGHPLTLKPAALKPVTSDEYQAPARRPANSLLDTGLIERQLTEQLPHWREAFEHQVRGMIRGRMAA